MAAIDDSELIRISDFPDQASLRFLSGGCSRLVQPTSAPSAKLDSVNSMEAKLVEIQKTLSQICNQLGIHPIEAETSRQTLPVPYSDPYIRDDHNRFPLDNSESLMPEFDGSNVSDWLSKVEQFFSMGRYSDLTKLDLVAFSLEGDVLLWFDREMTRREFYSWDEFRRRLLLKFGVPPEKSSENVAEILEEKASYTETKLIPQCQVPISSLEPSLSFSSESLDVSQAWQSEIVSNNRVHSQAGVGCVKNKTNAHHVFDELFRMLHDPGGKKIEHSDDIFETEVVIDTVQRTQRDIVVEACDAEIDVLDGTATWIVTSQPANNIEEAPGNRLLAIQQKETAFAYVTAFEELSTQIIALEDSHLEQVFNEGLKTEIQEVLKLTAPVGLENQKKSRCLKASLFNFKQKHKRIKRSHNQQQQHQLKRKFTKSWSFKYKDIEEDVDIAQVTLLLQLILDDLRSRMRHKWKYKHLRAVFGLQNNPSYALDVVTEGKTTAAIFQLLLERSISHDCLLGSLGEKKNVSWLAVVCVLAERMMRKVTVISAKLPETWRGRELVAESGLQAVLEQIIRINWNLMLLEFFLFIHLEDKVCLSGASNSWCGWRDFDRGKYNIISGDVIILVFLDLKKCFFHGAEKRDVQTMLLEKAKDAHVDSLIVWIKELWIANMVEINTGVSWAELKWIIWSVSSNIVEAYTKIIDKLQIKLKQGMDLHGASWHCVTYAMKSFHSPIGLVDALQSEHMFLRLFLRQHISSSIWHRWRRKTGHT